MEWAARSQPRAAASPERPRGRPRGATTLPRSSPKLPQTSRDKTSQAMATRQGSLAAAAQLVLALALLLGCAMCQEQAAGEAAGAGAAATSGAAADALPADRWLSMARASRGSEDAMARVAASFMKLAAPAAAGGGDKGAAALGALGGGSGLALSAGAQDKVQQFFSAASAAAGKARDFPVASDAVEVASSLLLNELAKPRAHVVERLLQLGQIGTTIISSSQACGAYKFNPGGAPVNAEWTGPTFTLTQTTGSCELRPAFVGDGNTGWTRLQRTLACKGPGTSWAWTPLTYEGVSRERTSLDGPECKEEVKFGPEVEVTLYGGSTKERVKFASQKDFYAAVLASKTFDFGASSLKAVLQSVQGRGGGEQLLMQQWESLAAGVGAWASPASDLLKAPAHLLDDSWAQGQLLGKGVGRSLFASRRAAASA